MKKLWMVLLLAAVLAGCGSPVDYETMSDVYVEPRLKAAAQLLVSLPPDAAVLTGEDGSAGSIWLCDGYTVELQTLNAGDLDATLRQTTGYGRDQLTVMELENGSLKRYECAWACAGEGGDQVARTVILDDGTYHYVVTLLTVAEQAGQLAETWQQIASSVTLDIVP